MKRMFVLVVIVSAALLLVSVPAHSTTYTFTQNNPFVFGGSTSSSSLTTSGVVGGITDVNVTLNGMHVNDFFQGISEFDILLVGPQGQEIILMSYVCEAFTTPGPVNFTFDNSGPQLPPGNGSTACVSGTYKPTDYKSLAFPFTYILEVPPAPAPPYTTNLTQLNSNSGNGTWTLYAAEHEGNEDGTITSWSLTIETDGIPLPCDYEDLFQDGLLTYTQLNPLVQETGGHLVLQPASKKAYTTSDPVFNGIQTGTFGAVIKFSTNGELKEKGWMVTHWTDKKHLMEIQFNVERGKVIVKQKSGIVLAKAKGDFAFAFNTPYTVEATYTGSVYEVRIDGQLIVSLNTVGPVPSGILGFQAKGLSQSIDSVCVSP